MLKELLSTLQTLGALEKRTDDVLNAVNKLSVKIDSISERVVRLESDQEHMKANIKNEILSEIKADILKVQFQMESLTDKSVREKTC